MAVVKLSEIPPGKKLEDYPEGTQLIWDDNFDIPELRTDGKNKTPMANQKQKGGL